MESLYLTAQPSDFETFQLMKIRFNGKNSLGYASILYALCACGCALATRHYILVYDTCGSELHTPHSFIVWWYKCVVDLFGEWFTFCQMSNDVYVCALCIGFVSMNGG